MGDRFFPVVINADPQMNRFAQVLVWAVLPGRPFRLFVRARDGRWYKQRTPEHDQGGRYHCNIQFGDRDVPPGSHYLLAALDAPDPLLNIYDALPDELLLSPVYEVLRV